MQHLSLFEDFTPAVSRKRELFNKRRAKTITPEESDELDAILAQHFAEMEREDAHRRAEQERYETEGNAVRDRHNARIEAPGFSRHVQEYVHSAAFKAWFGDWERAFQTQDYRQCSRMVDAQGVPLLLYHVTKHEWDKYELGKVSGSTHDMGRGVYFADAEHAQRWLDFVQHDPVRGEGKRIPAIKKPLFANVRRLKVVQDGFLDYEESGMEDNESGKYDGKVEGSLQGIEQGIVFDPGNVRFI